jgi:hypothetical protein
MDFKEIYPSWLFVLCDWADWYEIVSWKIGGVLLVGRPFGIQGILGQARLCL